MYDIYLGLGAILSSAEVDMGQKLEAAVKHGSVVSKCKLLTLLVMHYAVATLQIVMWKSYVSSFTAVSGDAPH